MSDGELRVHPVENADEVGFECADHALGNVAAMHVWRHFLVLAFPFDSDVGNVRGTCFVVEDLEVNSDAPRSEPLHDLVVHWDVVRVSP